MREFYELRKLIFTIALPRWLPHNNSLEFLYPGPKTWHKNKILIPKILHSCLFSLLNHICNNLLFVQQVLTKKGFGSNNTVFSIYFYLLMTMNIAATFVYCSNVSQFVWINKFSETVSLSLFNLFFSQFVCQQICLKNWRKNGKKIEKLIS